ncbi:MAG TPA: winged helix-turn-helix domain-containing protein [Rhodanobacteraceae bacterium]|nr:winged helix-turn-helix domain-containing protein [Rhodanobacteraceae bacterium]
MVVRTCHFGRFRLDIAARELFAASERVDLSASAFDCLVYLVVHRDRAVGRDELISAVWGRTDVSDLQLSQAVSRIRSVLGNKAGRQAWIRTIPRYGYRWVADTRCDDVSGSLAPIPANRPAAQPAAASSTDETIEWQEQETVVRPDSRALLSLPGALPAAIVLCLIAVLVLGYSILPHAGSVAPAAPFPATRTSGNSVAVLPAKVAAPSQWKWLRLGLMSLIADRLRSGGLPTLPSETVIHLRAARTGEAAGLADGSSALTGIALLRVQPEVTFDADHWRVRLQMKSVGSVKIVEAMDSNPLDAARSAADQLLARLGYKPPLVRDHAPGLEQLIRRIGAASLAGKLDLAATLIREAPDDLRAQPEIRLSAAKNVFRAGEYDEARRQTLALLDARSMHARPVLRGRALNLLAAIAFRQDHLDRAAQVFAEAVGTLRGQADRSALGIAYMGQAVVAARGFHYDDAVAGFGRARVELAAAGDLVNMAQVDENLGNMQALRHRPYLARHILEGTQERFAQLGAQEQRGFTLSNLTQVLIQLLEHKRVLATSDMFWPPEQHSSNPRLRWRLVWTRAAALTDNGRLAEARKLLQRIDANADPQRDAEMRAMSTALAAQIAAQAHDMTATERLSAAARTRLLREADPLLYVQVGMLHARALRRAGKLAQAAAETAELGQEAGDPPDPRRAIYIALAKAEQATAVHDEAQAVKGFAEALEGAQALAIPEDLVAVSRPYVKFLLAQGHLKRAQAVAGGVAIWADQDFYAAWTQACLLNRLDSGRTAHTATLAMARLAGERPLPSSICGNVG